ncbi:MAG: DNA (cytosine-5-)-methyltransferase [Actinomycetota bacterium]|nr:DNA (cytosine-5-)-methyltransferase [Actinomycetota bacterium]
MGSYFTVAGLFAGIGGLEQGFAAAGGRTEILCEWWSPARAVLAHRFPDVPLAADVRDLRSLPSVDVVTAGFPCTDLSQAGRTTGIGGAQSGLVGEVFRLLRNHRAPLLVLENVRNMLVLDGGAAMRYLTGELESLGYRWAYRLLDSRFTGMPQRRQRVLLVAARDIDPRDVLFADDAGEPGADRYHTEAHGFYWTEGLRGLGWAQDAVPTLKGGSSLGIPSPPAVWWPAGPLGGRVVVPDVAEAEVLQGFEPGWTEAALQSQVRNGPRWKLVGNAVTVGVSAWLGRRLVGPGQHCLEEVAVQVGSRWPTAAFGAAGQVWAVNASMWPVHEPYRHLAEVVDLETARPLSARATAGFLSRARRSGLRFAPGFLVDVEGHLGAVTGRVSVVA